MAMITLTTVREVADDDLDAFLDALKPGLPWLDNAAIHRDGRQSHTSTNPFLPGKPSTAVTTIVVRNRR